MFRSEHVVNFPPGASKFGEVVTPNNDDTYHKKIYLSEHDLSKFASSMDEISNF
jgi:hypothetical protein